LSPTAKIFGPPKGTLRTPEFIPVYRRWTGNSSSPCFASSPCALVDTSRVVKSCVRLCG
jgi:hypothetical protein